MAVDILAEDNSPAENHNPAVADTLVEEDNSLAVAEGSIPVVEGIVLAAALSLLSRWIRKCSDLITATEVINILHKSDKLAEVKICIYASSFKLKLIVGRCNRLFSYENSARGLLLPTRSAVGNSLQNRLLIENLVVI